MADRPVLHEGFRKDGVAPLAQPKEAEKLGQWFKSLPALPSLFCMTSCSINALP